MTEEQMQAALKAVREHETRLAVLERRFEDHQLEIERRFRGITHALDRIDANLTSLTWKVAGSAFGGGGLIAAFVAILQGGL